MRLPFRHTGNLDSALADIVAVSLSEASGLTQATHRPHLCHLLLSFARCSDSVRWFVNTQQLSNLIRHRYEMVFGDLYLSGSISDLAAAQRTSRLAGVPDLEAEVEKTVRRILRKEQARFSSREETVLIRERLEFAIAVLEQLPKTKDAQVWVAFLESQQSYSDHDLLESVVELIHRQRDHFLALFAPSRPVRHDFRQ